MRAEIDRASGLWKDGIDYNHPPDDAARQIDEAIHSVWNVDQPAMASVRSFKLGGSDAVLYQPFDVLPGVIFYIHGGGWSLCSLKTHERFMRYLAQTSRLAVVGIDYRLAPQHPYPAPLTDVVSAYRDLVSNRETYGLPDGEIVVAGDSAGANLALALMLHESDAGRALPAGGLLFYGAFGLDFATPSYDLYGTDQYLLSTFQMRQFWSWYLPDAKDRESSLAVPLHSNDAQLRNLPPLFLVAAELDPLADDTLRLNARLAAAGRNDQLHIEPGVVHGFLQMTAFLEAARSVTALASDAAKNLITRARVDGKKPTHSGELAMVATLGVAAGLMSLDQGSPSYLMPFVKSALHLDNTQIGAAVSAYWLMFAIGSSLAGAVSEKLGRKRLLVLVLASFAVCSVLPSFAQNFTQFAAARGVMGVLAGAMFALCQSILALGSSPTTVGRNMGLVTGFAGNIFGMLIGPVLLVQVAVALGWRAGFLTVVAPMALCALLAWIVLREPRPITARNAAASSSLKEIASIRNVWLCALLSSLFVAYVSLGLAFLPLYLTEARSLSSAQMSLLISLLGLAAIVYSVVLPFISDRIGRKPTLVAASVLSVGAPLAALYLESPLPVLGAALFFGWGIAGTASFSMGTIPSESVPTHLVSKAFGVIIAFGVLVGGLAGPSLAGLAADRWGVGAPLLLHAGCALLSAMVSLALRETRP